MTADAPRSSSESEIQDDREPTATDEQGFPCGCESGARTEPDSGLCLVCGGDALTG